MSISTQGGGGKRPSKATTGGKPADEATTEKTTTGSKAKSTAGAGKGTGGAGKGGSAVNKGKGGGKGPRKPVAPVKVGHDRPWGAIAMISAVALLAVGIIAWASWGVYQNARSWEDRANDIDGIVNYRETNPEIMQANQHAPGPQKYFTSPAVGGVHNNDWQNCMGDIYDAPIAQEHAVHSLEHGAVWITYRPDLPADQVEKLASKVRGQEKMLMSPYEGLDKPISLQAWGYQLKVDNADDERVDEFIKALRVNASLEGPTALCERGITATGTTPRDLPPAQQQ